MTYSNNGSVPRKNGTQSKLCGTHLLKKLQNEAMLLRSCADKRFSLSSTSGFQAMKHQQKYQDPTKGMEGKTVATFHINGCCCLKVPSYSHNPVV